MDLESELGSKIPIELDSDTLIGRQSGLGFGPSSTDRSISRRHLSLRLVNDPVDGFRVGLKVIGKNPIWVCPVDGGHGRMYKKFEKGELRVGDKLSLSMKKPFFFVVKRIEGEGDGDEERKRVLSAVERREKRTLNRSREKEEKAKEEVLESDDGEGIESVDVSHIDPVKEFGFLVKGREFDKYSKKKIAGIKNWNWFLEETSAVSDNDDDEEMIDEPSSSKGKKGRGTKKKKHRGDDDEWAGDGEEENLVVVKGGSAKLPPKYTTRSKDSIRLRNDTSKKYSKVHEDEIEDEDEEDETLGGFIVDEEEEVEEEAGEDEESEEEFDDDEEEFE